MRTPDYTSQFKRDDKRDLVLIYPKPNADSLRLVRLGSHSELGL
jgi:mRNA-degrading endonuclease YafQ of YafQ-DinJ toxin-antitoxin module